MSQKKKNPVATVCSLLGTILLIVLILGCIPLTVPKAFGYNIYTVISGSMEPAIPVGSLVYVKYQEPETIQKKDVIAFYGAKDASSIVTHIELLRIKNFLVNLLQKEMQIKQKI